MFACCAAHGTRRKGFFAKCYHKGDTTCFLEPLEPLEAFVTAPGSSRAFAEARTFEFCRLPTFEVRPRVPGARVRCGPGVNLFGSASHGAGAVELAAPPCRLSRFRGRVASVRGAPGGVETHPRPPAHQGAVCKGGAPGGVEIHPRPPPLRRRPGDPVGYKPTGPALPVPR